MDDTTTRNLLTLTKDNQDGVIGVVVLPDCHQLTLKCKYEKRESTGSSDKARVGREGVGDSSYMPDRKSEEEIRKELTAVLEDVKGMNNCGMRTNLVNCLEQKKRVGLERNQDMRVDLRNIVSHFGYWGKLDVLIEWVIDIDSSPKIVDRLKKIRRENPNLGQKPMPESSLSIKRPANE